MYKIEYTYPIGISAQVRAAAICAGSGAHGYEPVRQHGHRRLILLTQHQGPLVLLIPC